MNLWGKTRAIALCVLLLISVIAIGFAAAAETRVGVLSSGVESETLADLLTVELSRIPGVGVVGWADLKLLQRAAAEGVVVLTPNQEEQLR